MNSSHTETASLHWTPSLQVHGQEFTAFDHNGSRYTARRDTSGAIVYLSKRQHSNGRGLYYQPMNVKGKAARIVIAEALTDETVTGEQP